MSDDEFESNTCPLCVEEMDLSDKNFLPCPCGYKVCMWCWHHIRENLNGLCPACRAPYNSDPHAFSAVDRQEVVKKNRERKQKEKQEKKVNDKPVVAKSQPVERKQLHNYRVVQRNLVYVLGLPFNLGNEETLRKPEYFGQYGKIVKIVVLHKSPQSTQTTISAYVTFAFKEDAAAAIQALDGYWLENHPLKVSFGTTKFCNNWIRSLPCNNPECVYLHEMGDDDDRFTKEDIQAGNNKVNVIPSGKEQIMICGQGGPSGTGKRPPGEPVLPAPLFYQDVPVPVTASRPPAGLMRSTSLSMPVTGGGQGVLQHDYTGKESNEGTTTAGQSAAKGAAETTTGTLRKSATVPTAAERSISLSSVVLPSEKSDLASMKETKVATSKLKATTQPLPAAVVIGKAHTELKPTRGGGSKVSQQREVEPEPVNTDHSKDLPRVAIPSAEEVKESMLSFLAPSPTNSDRGAPREERKKVSALDFNGITDNAVFPVPVSSLTTSVWGGVVGKAAGRRGDLKFNPFGQFSSFSFSDLMNLTLPPVDAVSCYALPVSSVKMTSAVADGYSAKQEQQPNLSSTFQQAQLSLGLAPPQSVEQMQAAQQQASRGAADSAAAAPTNGLHALKQLFPTVNLAYGSQQKSAFPPTAVNNSSNSSNNGRMLGLGNNNSVLG